MSSLILFEGFLCLNLLEQYHSDLFNNEKQKSKLIIKW